MIQKWRLKIINFTIFALAILGLILLVSIPSFFEINNLVLDTLQRGSDYKARSEIVILGIDDKSLQTIGAWPWDRDVFATAFDNLEKSKVRVVGVDVLFLEARRGDDKFNQSLRDVSFPTILGSKLESDNLLQSKLTGPKVKSGLINFNTDNDGKIRRLDLVKQATEGCQQSFSFQIFQAYLGLKNESSCDSKDILLRRDSYQKNMQIASVAKEPNTDGGFKQISFVDVYQGNINPNELEGKIVLIGSTSRDLKNNLNDNFIDVFGRQTPGVAIHANALNTLLEKHFQTDFDYKVFLSFLAIFALFSFTIYQFLKQNKWEIGYFVVSLVANNLVGIFIYGLGWNWLFIQTNIVILFTYIYYVAFKYLILQKQSRFLENAFGQYVNPQLLQQLIANPEQLKLGGQRKELTVMFSDIRGFTTFSEQLSPEELISLINDYLDLMTKIILNNNGTIDKFIGDAIMAFWNAPLDQDRHRELALKTSIEMQLALDKFNLEKSLDIHIGIGINTGDMIVGNVGSTKRFDYTLLGDNVNLGSRLEGLSKKYGVTTVVAESVTQNLDSQEFLFRQLDEAKVKGKDKAIKMYEPLSKNAENQNLINTFTQAFDLYQKGDFIKAKKIFAELKNDPVSKKYLLRIENLTTEQKSVWNGIWTWDEK